MKASWWSHSLERVRRGLSILWEGSRVGMGEGGGVSMFVQIQSTSYPIIHFLRGDENKRIGRSAADLVFHCLL